MMRLLSWKKPRKREHSASSILSYLQNLKEKDKLPLESKLVAQEEVSDIDKNPKNVYERLPVFPSWTDLSPMQLERQRTIYELIETEKTFVGEITHVLQVSRRNILNSKLLSDEEAATLEQCFIPLWSILSINEKLLNLMICQKKDDLVDEICSSILTIIDEFERPYSHFAATCDNVLVFLLNLANIYPNLRDIYIEKSFSLTEVYSRPLQRLMQYQLLFERIVYSTPDDHSDFLPAEELAGRIRTILLYVETVKDTLDRIWELKTFERKMSFKNAVSLDGKKKKCPKFTFKLFRGDGTRWVVLQDPFFLVSPNNTSVGNSNGKEYEKLPFTIKQVVRLFMTNDLLFIGSEMTETESKKEGKSWKMFHEPVPLSSVKMEILSSIQVANDAIPFYWCRLSLQPAETYYLSASLSQLQCWAKHINNIPSNPDLIDEDHELVKSNYLSRRGSIIKSVLQSIIPSRSNTSTPTSQFYESTEIQNDDDRLFENLSFKEEPVFLSKTRVYFWNNSTIKAEWVSYGCCVIEIEHNIIEEEDLFSLKIVAEDAPNRVLFTQEITEDFQIAIEPWRNKHAKGHSRNSSKSSICSENSMDDRSYKVSMQMRYGETSKKHHVVCRMKKNFAEKLLDKCCKLKMDNAEKNMKAKILQYEKKKSEEEKAKSKVVQESMQQIVFEFIEQAVMNNLQTKNTEAFTSDDGATVQLYTVEGSYKQDRIVEENELKIYGVDSEYHELCSNYETLIHEQLSESQELIPENLIKSDDRKDYSVIGDLVEESIEVSLELNEIVSDIGKEVSPKAAAQFLNDILATWYIRQQGTVETEFLETEYNLAKKLLSNF